MKECLEIHNKFHLACISALVSFIEKTSFKDFMYSIDNTVHGNITQYTLSLLNNQYNSLLDIKVNAIRNSQEDYSIEVKMEDKTFKVDKEDVPSIMKTIEQAISTYVANKTDFLKNISKAFR